MPVTVHFDAGSGHLACHPTTVVILQRDRNPTAVTCGNCTRTKSWRRRLQVIDLEELLER